MKRRSAVVVLLLAGTTALLAFQRRPPFLNIHAPAASTPKQLTLTRSYRPLSVQSSRSSPEPSRPSEVPTLFVAQTPSKSIVQSLINVIRSAVGHVVSFVKKMSSLWRGPAPEVSPLDDFPAALFVNRKSGGKDGKALLKSLYKHINKQFICDVLHEAPHKRLARALSHHWTKHGVVTANHSATAAPLLPVICCGGDGTIRWIMDEAHAHGHSQYCSFGIMPMGTGNDLFNHVLTYVADRQQASRLAAQLSPGNQIHQTLRALSTFDMSRCDAAAPTNASMRATAAYTVDFDRWQISVLAHPLSRTARLREKLKSSLAQSSASLVRRLRVTSRRAVQRSASDGVVPQQSAAGGPVKSRIAFNNYFGIGIDGDITCAFDNLRKQRPQWFFHRLINKAWYGMVWTYKVFRGNAKDLSRDIDVYVDGQRLNTSALDLRGVILPNIVSYAGGTRLWTFAGEEVPSYAVPSDRSVDDGDAASRRWQAQSSEDGLLEVVGLTGWTHLASVKGGFMRPIPLAQGRHIRIVSKVRLPMQVDGEPLIQAPCVLDVRLLETVKLVIPQPVE